MYFIVVIGVSAKNSLIFLVSFGFVENVMNVVGKEDINLYRFLIILLL